LSLQKVTIMSNNTYTPAERAATLVDSAAQSAEHAIRGSQRMAHDTLDRLADQADSARAAAGAAFDDLSSGAAGLAHRGAQALRERSQYLHDQATHARDATRVYIQHDPLKAVLMAAAAGAALMLVANMLSRRSSR
jgi:ElaB/YqjD/DUF883 family membrane-anchored ribosome-binding protein